MTKYPSIPESDVDAIYWAYPRHVGKIEARRAIRKAILDLARRGVPSPAQYLLKVTSEFAKSPAGQAGSFTPYPATWFNAGRYDDDRSEWSKRDVSAQKKNPDAESAKAAQQLLAKRGEQDRQRIMEEYLKGRPCPTNP